MTRITDSVSLIKRLSLAFGPSGCEDNVKEIIKELAAHLCDDMITDRLGNLICKMSFGDKSADGRKRIMIAAHTDEVGFMIDGIRSDGMLTFGCVGGIDPSVLAGRKVHVGNEKGLLRGVICSKAIHHKEKDEREKPIPADKMYIDLGFSSKEEAEEKIGIGDFGTFDSEFYRIGKDGCMIKGKALDDRMGCAAMIEIMSELSVIRPEVDVDVYFCFTVREEIGYSGAAAAASRVKPDIAVVLESTAIGDIPKTEAHRRVADVGEGVVISVADRATIYDRDTVERAMKLAEDCGVSAQIKRYVSGGNDAGKIHKAIDGIRVLALSVPTRYLHSPSCVAAIDDYIDARELAKNIVIKNFMFI